MRTLLSAALTRISSTILKNPGTYVISLLWYIKDGCHEAMKMVYLLVIRLFSESYTHMYWVWASTLPIYESGRFKICSSCVSLKCVSSSMLTKNTERTPFDTFGLPFYLSLSEEVEALMVFWVVPHRYHRPSSA